MPCIFACTYERPTALLLVSGQYMVNVREDDRELKYCIIIALFRTICMLKEADVVIYNVLFYTG